MTGKKCGGMIIPLRIKSDGGVMTDEDKIRRLYTEGKSLDDVYYAMDKKYRRNRLVNIIGKDNIRYTDIVYMTNDMIRDVDFPSRMTDEEKEAFLVYLTCRDDGLIIISRAKQSYLELVGLWDYVCSKTPDFDTPYEKVARIISGYRAGYCEVCGERTAINNKQDNFFARYHRHCYREIIAPAANKARSCDVDRDEIIRLYVEEGLSLSEICRHPVSIDKTTGKHITEPTAKKIIGDNMRSLTEAQANYNNLHRDPTKSNIGLPVETIMVRYQEDKNLTLMALSKEYDCNPKTIGDLLRRNNIKVENRRMSSHEYRLNGLLSELGVEYNSNYNGIIPPKELDLYIPEKRLAIEVNGVYWHSEKFRDKHYHYNKYKECKEKGVELLQFTDKEVDEYYPIIKSIILNKLGASQRIYARKCSIRTLSTKTERDFLTRNHIQGYSFSNAAYGLYYNDELVMCMSFGKPRFNRKYEWEIVRLCATLGTTVVGGASKLFRHFVSTHSPRNMLTYADLRFGSGRVYETLGFTHSHISSPSYIYTNGNHVLSRYKCQKHKLEKLFPEHYNKDKSELDIMTEAGYYRVYDAGNNVYIQDFHGD